MAPHNARRIDPLTDGEGQDLSPHAQRLAATLERAYWATPSPRLDTAMIAALHAGTSPGRRLLMPGIWPRTIVTRHLVSLGATLALLVGGAGYLRLSGPTPVSAQTVLSRVAAALRLAPDQVAHLTYAVTVTMPAIRRAPADADSALRTRPSDHYIQIGSQGYGYERGNNAISIPGTHDQHPGWMIPNEGFDGATVAGELSTLAQHSPQQVQVLPQETLDGSTVDVLQVNGWSDAPAMRATFYFDAQSFLLRGFDTASSSPAYPTPSWQVRLRSYATVAPTVVPAGTFTLNPPTDARVEPGRLDPALLVATFATVCQSTRDSSQIDQILQAKTQSLLAACQATAPTVARTDLVTALITPYTVALSSAVSAGQVTPTQETAAIAAQQQWLDTLVTTPGGGTSAS